MLNFTKMKIVSFENLLIKTQTLKRFNVKVFDD